MSSVADKLKEAGLHSVIYGLGSVAQSALGFILIPLLTGRLSTEAFGAYSMVQMAGTIAASVFYLGMTSALPRSYFDYQTEQDRRSVFTTAFLILLCGAAAQVVIGFTLGGSISRVLLRTDRYGGDVAWAFLSTASAFVNQYFFTYIRFLRHSVTSVLLSLVSLGGSVWLSLYLLERDRHDLSAPFKAIFFTQIFIILLFIWRYARGAFTRRLSRREVPVLLRFGVPTIFASLAVMTIDWADRLVIERARSVAEVGVYSAAFRLGSVINALMISPFVQIWNPMMMEFRTHANIGEFFSRIISYYFLAGTLVLLGAALLVNDLLPFLARGPDYASSSPIIILIMAGYLIHGATNMVTAGLIYERRVMRIVLIVYGVAVVSILLKLALVPTYGIFGAGVASFITYALVPLASYWQARRFFRIDFEWWRLARLAVFFVGSLAWALGGEARVGTSFVGRGAMFVALALLLLRVGTSATERQAVRDFLRRRSVHEAE